MWAVTFERARRALESRFFLPCVVLIGIVATIPLLSVGLMMDDLLHRHMLAGDNRWPVDDALLFGLFTFFDGNAQRTSQMIVEAALPWWTSHNIVISFFRPLSELTHWLDFALWPDSAAMMHAHSIAWYLLLVVLLCHLYRQLFDSRWIAGLALLLYAFDYAHSTPITWIANRNALIATSLGIATLILHHRWRTGQSRHPGWGCLTILLALLSAEQGLATAGYLFAYECFMVGNLQQSSLRQRFMALLPYALVSFAWLGYHRVSGYGTAHSDFYVDVGSDPLAFLLVVAERMPVLLFSQWSGFIADFYAKLDAPHGQQQFWWVACAMLLATLALLWPVLRDKAHARFFLLGMLLSSVLVCSVAPSNRLFIFMGVGAMGLMGSFLGYWFERGSGYNNKPLKAASGVMAVWLMVVHLLVGPVGLAYGAVYVSTHGDPKNEDFARNIPFGEGVESKKLLYIQADAVSSPSAVMLVRNHYQLPMPQQAWFLSFAHSELTIERESDRSILVSQAGGFVANNLAKLYRSKEEPYVAADMVAIDEMQFEIIELDHNQMPVKVRLTSQQSFDQILWLRWNGKRYVVAAVPRQGEVIVYPRAIRGRES